MPPPDNEPKALAVDLLSEIISYVKQGTPTRSNDTSTQGFVYSQLRVGQMISPRDFGRPWSPIGQLSLSSPAPAAPPANGAPPPDANAAESPRRAAQATVNTQHLVDTMLVITDDGTLETYSGGGRHLSFAYKEVLDSMEAPPAPPRTPEEEQRLNEARKVLYEDDEGLLPTKLYDRYQQNQLAYAKARGERVTAELRILGDPAQAGSAQLLLEPFQVAVDQARTRWLTQGADKIERAIATLQSLGVPLEQGAIMNARTLFDSWNIPLLGVPAREPFSSILPSDWAVLEMHDIGWTKLTIETRDYMNHFEQHGFSLHTADWAGNSEASSGEAGIGIFGFGFNGSYSEASNSTSSESTSFASDGTQFHNDAKNMSIELEYGLCNVVRPWLLTDIFHLRNWFIPGQRAGAVSSGRIDDQVGSETPLLPLIPTHFIVIRNVKISAEHWNSDGAVFESFNSRFSSHTDEHQSTLSGGVEIPVFGPLSVDFGASHSESGYSGSYQDQTGHDFSNDYKSHFDGTTLSIGGAQIVAWLSEVVPKAPPMDDPHLPNP